MDGSTSTTPQSRIIVTRRAEQSFITNVFHRLLRPFGPQLVKPSKSYPAGSVRLTTNSSAAKKCNITERKVDDIWIYDLTCKTTPRKKPNASKTTDDSQKNDEKKKNHPYRVYYFAGGGWQMPASSHHWKTLSVLAKELPEATISIVSYPLSPNSPAPVTFPRLLRLYRTLLSEAEKAGHAVTLAGDSAGANIVLALTIEALRQDPELRMPRPHSLLAICPAVDLTHQNPQYLIVEPRDPVLRVATIKSTAQAWAGEWSTEDPRVSPAFADVSVLHRAGVIVDGVTGGYDILGADAVLFRDKCEREGVEGEWLDWAKQMHCWPLASSYKIMPESNQAWSWVVDLIRRRSSGD